VKIAVIPARGGSKRIPHKNIRDFCGKPIIAYSIEQAINLELFDRVIVSTDDEEIALVARNYGADTPFIRPSDISDDFTGTNAVVKHAIEWFQQQEKVVEFACCIYATAPFVQARYLQEGYEKLVKSNSSFAFSVTSFAFQIQRAIRINTQGKVEAIWPENINIRSQDLEDTFHDAGQFYWGTAAAFLQNQATFSTESIPVILPRFLVQDIDTEEDWFRAELMYKVLQEKNANK
jgi:N-acylneuraminate cytidylyltransferase